VGWGRSARCVGVRRWNERASGIQGDGAALEMQARTETALVSLAMQERLL